MKLSILLPNKSQGEKLIQNLVKEILPYFDSKGFPYEVLICPNGCSEEEMAYFQEVSSSLPPQVRVLPNAEKGKGSGVKQGILAAQGEYVLFMDADLATGLEVFDRVYPLFGVSDAIVASRDVKGSRYGKKQPFVRRLTHFVSRQIIAAMFRLHIKDTQCGYKCFRHSVAKKMVEKQTILDFAFDVEYLYFLRLNGFRIDEVPCVWTDDPDSTITKKGSVYRKFFADLKKVKKNKDHYRLSEKEKEETHAH